VGLEAMALTDGLIADSCQLTAFVSPVGAETSLTVPEKIVAPRTETNYDAPAADNKSSSRRDHNRAAS
jgi:hypothetical protein